MLDSLLNTLFGCSHRRISFPQTPSRRTAMLGSNFNGDTRTGTYVACLDCGKEFDYDWQGMHVGAPVAVPARAQAESFYAAK